MILSPISCQTKRSLLVVPGATSPPSLLRTHDISEQLSPVHCSTPTHPLETRGAPEALEAPRPANESARVELRFHTLAPQVENRQDAPMHGVVVDIEVLGVEAGDEELRVLTDFDNGAIRLWQVRTRAFLQLLVRLFPCHFVYWTTAHRNFTTPHAMFRSRQHQTNLS